MATPTRDYDVVVDNSSFPPLAELVIPTEWQNAHDDLMREILSNNSTSPTKTKEKGSAYQDDDPNNGTHSRRASFSSIFGVPSSSSSSPSRRKLMGDGDDDDEKLIDDLLPTSDDDNNKSNNNNNNKTNSKSSHHHQKGQKNKAHTVTTSSRYSSSKDDDMMMDVVDRQNKNNNKMVVKTSFSSSRSAGESSVQSPSGPMEELDSTVMNGSNINLVVPNVVKTTVLHPGLDVMDLHHHHNDDFGMGGMGMDDDDDELFMDVLGYNNTAGTAGNVTGSSGNILASASTGLNTSTLDGMLAMVSDVMDYSADDDVDDDGDVDMMDAGGSSSTTTNNNTVVDFASSSSSSHSHKVIAGLPYEQRYKATFEKLQASLKRSQETRKCLSIQTIQTQQYDRIASVNGVLSSIKASSSQLQKVVAKTTVVAGSGCPGSPIPQRQVM